MSETKPCPQCGSALPEGAESACLRCLLLLGLDDDSLASSPGREVTDLVGQTLLHYRILGWLGRGGMGLVYDAEDTKLHRRVALKVLPATVDVSRERLERFRREARAAAALNHPNIVTLYSVEEADEVHFLTMERVEGQTLAERITREGLPLAEILAIARPLVSALAAAHKRGIVHRDLKPANVMIEDAGDDPDGSHEPGAPGTVKVLDFGLAKRIPSTAGEASAALSLTGDGVVLGTLPYTAPEQIQGHPADARADIYAFGALLYEMAVGRRPFDGDSAADLLASVLRDPPSSISSFRSGLPASLDRLVQRCLAKEPELRFPTAHDLLVALAEVEAEVEVLSAGSQPVEIPPTLPPTPGAAPFLTESDALASASLEPLGALGRDDELAHLQDRLDEVFTGLLRVVFVAGEAGLGKTTLVRNFAHRVRRMGAPWLGYGQCLEHRGSGEAYMPVLEALARLCRQPGGREIVRVLAHQAPTWMVQMPWLVEPSELGALQSRVLGATRERMLREMGGAIEALAASRPMILVLEDLHWSDVSTLDLIAWLARRNEATRLLLVGTYRPAEIRRGAHPFAATARELALLRQCETLQLDRLDPKTVEDYLEARFPDSDLPPELARVVHQRTGGNPLYMEAVLDDWRARGHLVEDHGTWRLEGRLDSLAREVPESLRHLIEQQLEELEPPDQAILEAASVAGHRVSAAAVAAGVDVPDEEAEERCDRLARRGRFLDHHGTSEWPDGTVAARFGFLHDLYQEVLYQRVPPGRRVTLHRRIGLRLEAAYGEHVRERAGELAVHFVRGREPRRAALHLQGAAERALQRSAHREAAELLTQALDLLKRLPEDTERIRREVVLQISLAQALIVTRGWGASEVDRAYQRAHDLSLRLDDSPLISTVLYGLATLRELRGEYHASEALLQKRLRLPCAPEGAHQEQSSLESRELLACSTFHQGRFSRALEHAEKGLAVFDPKVHATLIAQENLGVSCHDWAALALWFLGAPDRALSEGWRALELAEELDHAYTRANALSQLAMLHQLRREPEAAREQASASVALALEHGFPYRVATGNILLGWTQVALGAPEDGLATLHRGLESYRDTGAEMDRAYFLALLAEGLGIAGQVSEGLEVLREAEDAAPTNREFFYQAELHRLRGILLSQSRRSATDEATACFRQALEVARRQKAIALELRAALSLVRSTQGIAGAAGPGGNDSAEEAFQLLGSLYDRFHDGLDTPDLVEARALLEAVATRS